MYSMYAHNARVLSISMSKPGDLARRITAACIEPAQVNPTCDARRRKRAEAVVAMDPSKDGLELTSGQRSGARAGPARWAKRGRSVGMERTCYLGGLMFHVSSVSSFLFCGEGGGRFPWDLLERAEKGSEIPFVLPLTCFRSPPHSIHRCPQPTDRNSGDIPGYR